MTTASTRAPARLTDWFPAGVKPVRVGVYLTLRHELGDTEFSAKWDGSRWLTDDWPKCIDGADASVRPSRYQDRPWRGLTQEAKC